MDYLKYSLISVVMFLAAPSFAENVNFYNYSYGVSYQTLSVNDINEGTELDMQVDDMAHSIGIYYKGEPRSFYQFAIGLDYVYIEDDNPFSEEVKNAITGEVESRESDVTGTSIYGELGLISKDHLVENFTIGALAGYRYNNISRSIFRCSSCEEQELDNFKSSGYIKPFIEYQFTRRIHVQLSYSHYFNDEGFENSIGLHISFMSL
ncbi:hypothetical protein [Pseudoalteromonas phenolica]|uniref:Outer membrane protein beta-barrel domain-containing protein n=1 Tax=Pseudoalteromonas phenolica TaxID=161398 RepID=A0A0S2K6T3_9GAMM|nr:hypothetical protein [Pseudoalteromonas phenolica]ALO44043.1 hypothetical protein PP2015_3569 [Pseudoalteromonas phenolica]MBE0357020.1 hypothetical protein [Pseudoalteromonas phenolica O-BC30]RXE93050.1 hypothetical protein D9981_20990 [Pseudoalteromonas phenolica O-BC30]